MLKYFIAVTDSLIAAAALLGLLYAYAEKIKKGGAAVAVGIWTGAACAAVMAYLKNRTSLIHTGVWNTRIFTLSLATLIVFAVLSVLKKKTGTRGDFAMIICAGVLAFTFVFYALPDVLAYPFTISLNGASVFSTFYLLRLIGWILGLALVALTFIAVRNTARRSRSEKVPVAALAVALGINALSQASKILQVLVTRRVLRGRMLFSIALYTSNYSDIFIYAILIAAFIVSVKLLSDSFQAREPDDANPAQRRRIRAGWRDARRWSCTAAACFLTATLCMTWLTEISSRAVELSPIESSELRGDNIYIALSQVNDGHLHRFAYTTEKGKDLRFIIIQKPNSSSYGVGLDACDICGETGYYERNGQVVCGLCDVVMNINTIGFKGGCNPIVIDYSVRDGYIIVPVSTLMEHESEFK